MKALAHAYIVNTNEVAKCNNRIQGIIDFYEAQKEIYK